MHNAKFFIIFNIKSEAEEQDSQTHIFSIRPVQLSRFIQNKLVKPKVSSSYTRIRFFPRKYGLYFIWSMII